MTPQEINAAVAAKLGHNWYVHGGIGGPHYDGPDYCHSIAAAWEIVECLNQRKDIHAVISPGTGQSHCVILFRNGGADIDGTSETTPMEICLAFLKLP